MSGKGRKLRPDMSTKVPTWKALGNRGEDLGTFRSPEPDGEPVPAIFGSLNGNSSFLLSLPFSSSPLPDASLDPGKFLYTVIPLTIPWRSGPSTAPWRTRDRNRPLGPGAVWNPLSPPRPKLTHPPRFSRDGHSRRWHQGFAHDPTSIGEPWSWGPRPKGLRNERYCRKGRTT